MAVPDSLKQMALVSLADYINTVCVNLRKCKKKMKEKAERIAEVVCDEIHQRLVKPVPLMLADEVSCVLLTAIDDWWANKNKYVLSECNEIMQELVKCVVHPCVTKLTPMRDVVLCSDLFSYGEFRSDIILPLLQPLLPLLGKLNVLNVHSKPKQTSYQTYIPENLEEFSGLADDEFLKNIVARCPSIKSLNVSRSKNVTNKSVSTILELNCLEKLDVGHTRIDEDGVTQLLLGLATKKTLKSLRTNFWTESKHLLLILSLLPHVTLSLVSFEQNANVEEYNHMAELTNVVGLDMVESVDNLDYILSNVGGNLSFLNVGEIDFNTAEQFITFLEFGEHFRNLKCLHVRFDIFFERAYLDMERLPGFQSVRCVKIYGRMDYIIEEEWSNMIQDILYQCVNVETLTVDLHRCFCTKESCFDALIYLSKRHLKKLKEMYFITEGECPNDCDDDKLPKLLLRRCKQLKVVTGLKSEYGVKYVRGRKVKFLR